MANPQTENGYIRIANEIWDEVIRRDFSKRQKDIMHFIWRLSYGCRKKAAFIPKLVHFELCGVGKNHIKDELLYLESCKVLFWDREAKLFEVNKNYDEWQVSPVKGWDEFRFEELIALNLKESSQNGNEKVPETGTKKFPKQELSKDGENEKFPKEELLSSQNRNFSGEKVPKTGTGTPDEPSPGAGSQLRKDIIKDSNKDSSSTTKVIPMNQVTGHGRHQDFSFGRIYSIYEKHFAVDGKVSEFEVQDLGFLFDDYGGEWVYEAMREAARYKVFTLAYLTKVLKGFRARGGTQKEEPLQVVGGQPIYQMAEDDPITQQLREVYQAYAANGSS
ncbi:replication protein [Paenibacillus sp. S-38]|uniref:replication protein n=1 Tax=Paenibacillus sp. S-38 TaxID=3416710 RepID=UPI003CEF2875